MLIKIRCPTHFVTLICTFKYYVLLNLSKKFPFSTLILFELYKFKKSNKIRSVHYIFHVHCSVDYEDIRGQRVSHHAVEAEYVSEMSGRQRLPHQAGRSG